MTAGPLDKLARRAAARSSTERAAPLVASLSRRELIGRGVLAAVALASLSRLGAPLQAVAAPTRCRSLGRCLTQNEAAFARSIECKDVVVHESLGPGISKDMWPYWECLSKARLAHVEGNRRCLQTCPPPKGRRPPSRTRSHQQPAAPPLAPTRYDAWVDECANCTSVQGSCCFGGPSPFNLCACATPGVTCQVYGCDG